MSIVRNNNINMQWLTLSRYEHTVAFCYEKSTNRQIKTKNVCDETAKFMNYNYNYKIKYILMKQKVKPIFSERKIPIS